jgi:hypothetical protein
VAAWVGGREKKLARAGALKTLSYAVTGPDGAAIAARYARHTHSHRDRDTPTRPHIHMLSVWRWAGHGQSVVDAQGLPHVFPALMGKVRVRMHVCGRVAARVIHVACARMSGGGH